MSYTGAITVPAASATATKVFDISDGVNSVGPVTNVGTVVSDVASTDIADLYVNGEAVASQHVIPGGKATIIRLGGGGITSVYAKSTGGAILYPMSKLNQ